ncbi:MAG TPA: radical SAM protein [Syntrophales bacterium]|nr:radical SAM protein [Syntrophales bacterium]
MNHHNIPCKVIDANLGGISSLLKRSGSRIKDLLREEGESCKESFTVNTRDKWTTRSFRYLESNIAALNNWEAYKNIDRYRRTVIDINRVLAVSAAHSNVRMSLSNYVDRDLSPVRSADLIRASATPELNPFYGYFKKMLFTELEKESPAVVGFSLNYLSQALCTFAMIGILRREHPGIRIVLGGGLVTSWVHRSGWTNPFNGLVDDFVTGPGEGKLLSIFGVPHAENNVSPDYNGLSVNSYLAPGTILPYSASSGCYWNRCSFCPERAEGNPYKPVPTDLVIKDLCNLTEKMKPVLIHLLDNALSPALLKTLSESSFGVPWYGFARISSHLTDLDFCLALKRSGCVMLQVGLESGDQGILDNMRKGFDLMMASSALKTLKKVGIATYVYLLFGTPSETITEARKTLDFTARHNNEIDFLNLAIFNLPAYSPEAKELKTDQFYEGDLSLYSSFLHPRGWGRNLVRQFLSQEFKKHPAVVSIMRKSPSIFTSNHAPFFIMNPH